MSSVFSDANSPLDREILEDKSAIDFVENVALCDNCENIILKPYQDTKLIYPKCRNVYNPQYELVQVQNQETTLAELSSQGELSFKDESNKSIRKTLNHLEANLENQEYVKKEFTKYREMETTDDTNKSIRNRNNRQNL